ncbi:MAG: hypothetical protein ACR2RE_06565 [Geminicoccaceae bacterium]
MMAEQARREMSLAELITKRCLPSHRARRQYEQMLEALKAAPERPSQGLDIYGVQEWFKNYKAWQAQVGAALKAAEGSR